MPVVNELPQKHESLTLLWNNPNPSSSLSNGYLASLADTSQFERFRVVWRMGTTDDNNTIEADYMPTGIGKIDGQTWTFGMSIVIRANGENTWSRRISVDNSTRFWVGDCLKVNAGGTDNTLVMPLRIYGVK